MNKPRHIWLLIPRMILILTVMMAIPMAGKVAEPDQLIFTYLVIAVLLAAQVYELYFFLNRDHREVRRLLEHIRNKEFNARFSGRYRDLEEVLSTFKDVRIDREVQFRFLEHIVELLETGIIVFDSKGQVQLSNTAASELCEVPLLGSWSQITRKNPELATVVGNTESSRKLLFSKCKKTGSQQLAIQLSRTRMLEEEYTLMTLQDVQGLVEDKETGAWVRLLRTLNHEIKNSITPIASLADTLLMILRKEDGEMKQLEDLQQEELSDMQQSASTLQQRSRSLYDFVNEYHKLTRIPPPDPHIINCQEFLASLENLVSSELNKTGIRLELLPLPTDLELRADTGLLEQALLNLLSNSKVALAEQKDGLIQVSAEKTEAGICFTIKDNGPGIEEDLLEDIHTPFFSTKSGGSGIGLPLVRQIMRLHGGSMGLETIVGSGTTVILRFPNEIKEKRQNNAS